jgi:hypothetical protein
MTRFIGSPMANVTVERRVGRADHAEATLPQPIDFLLRPAKTTSAIARIECQDRSARNTYRIVAARPSAVLII